MIIAAASLLIIGYLALGALLQLLVRDLATGLGLTGLVVSPAFGYAGVGFPILGMNAFAQVWGAILPLRWYMAVLLGQAARGLPLHDSARPFAALAALAVLYYAARVPAPARRSAEALARRQPRRSRPRRRAAARRRRSLCRRVAARARDPRRLHPAGAGAAGLRHLLPAALPQPDPAQDPDRGRRQRPERAQPQHRADAGRQRRGQRGGARRDAGRGARGARPRRGLRRGRHSARDRARRAQGQYRPHSDLRRCHLPVHLQDDGERHRARDQYAVVRARRRRRAHRRQPGQGDARIREPGRHPAAADLQSGRRLRQLHRAGGLRADPAADAADRRVDADRRRAGADRRRRVRDACSAAASRT